MSTNHGRRKEEFEIIDPYQQRAVEMLAELRGYSAFNQAVALMGIRKKDPKLAALLVRMLKTTLSPGTEKGPAPPHAHT